MQGQRAVVKKLTLTEIEGLVAHGVPDSTMASQIQRRGISFTPTQAVLDSLRAKGAGPKTLAAVSRERASAPPPHQRRSSPHAAPKHPKLTQAQLQHLIRIHASDAFIAEQIHSRGVDFSPTEADISSFSDTGAGSRTLAALRNLVVTGTVHLLTRPGASVSLDGSPAGQADSTGRLLLQDMLPGPHTVTLTKDGFHASQLSFTLGKRETRQLFVPLSWAGALLTISAHPSNASISVTGPESLSGPLDAARCSPGTYRITVSDAGYIPQKESITLTAGQTYQKVFHLAVDTKLLAATLAHAQAAFSSGNTDSAIRLFSQVVSIDPSNILAHKVLAEASFLKGNYPLFVNNARAAILGGQSVTIPLMHVGNFSRHSADPVNATISSGAITFACSPGTKCRIPKTVNYTTMGVPAVIADPSGTRMLRIAWVAGRGEFKIVRQLDFVPVGSKVVNGPRNPNMSIFSSGKYLATPQDDVPQYDAIIRLLREIQNP